jgi:hypothetical protein
MNGALTCMLCHSANATACTTCGFIGCKSHLIFHNWFFCTTDESQKPTRIFRYLRHVPLEYDPSFGGYFGPVEGFLYWIGYQGSCIFCGAHAGICYGFSTWRYSVCSDCSPVCFKNYTSAKKCAKLYREVRFLYFFVAKNLKIRDLKRHVWKLVQQSFCTSCNYCVFSN